jgi:hypothetical protein
LVLKGSKAEEFLSGRLAEQRAGAVLRHFGSKLVFLLRFIARVLETCVRWQINLHLLGSLLWSCLLLLLLLLISSLLLPFYMPQQFSPQSPEHRTKLCSKMMMHSVRKRKKEKKQKKKKQMEALEGVPGNLQLQKH